ncbi:uncharacterized protein TNCV_1770291 [Trichonephila clavipes]|nr:uncharacterized protein TNCV_1770291 [Trichonephila clavipes]
MGVAIPNVLQPGTFVWFEKTQGSLMKVLPVLIATDEAVGCMCAFLTMWWSSQRLVCRERPDPGLRVNDIARILWSQQLLTTQSERLN